MVDLPPIIPSLEVNLNSNNLNYKTTCIKSLSINPTIKQIENVNNGTLLISTSEATTYKFIAKDFNGKNIEKSIDYLPVSPTLEPQITVGKNNFIVGLLSLGMIAGIIYLYKKIINHGKKY